ncbi:MAG: serpin family protein [Candidatus Omnitrophica bacterium]|nr:serpin family protein [Candidatus Omnitrophota bacterium]
MIKRIFLPLVVLLLIAVFLAPIPAGAADVSAVVAANNQFAFELYARYKSLPGNIFYSPYSISSALAMTYEGGRGQTAAEMEKVFHFPSDAAARREAYLAIYQEINKADKKYTLNTANALWAQEGYPFLEEYFSLIEKYYGGKATNLDFRIRSEESRQTINLWVEERTNHKIEELIPSGMIGADTKLILTNVVYFKGSWRTPFDAQHTRKANFRTGDQKTVKVPTMYLSENKSYAEADGLQILELPYQGEDLSMLILLPGKKTLESVEASLNAAKVAEWQKLLQQEKVIIYLPKFKFGTKYFMRQDLNSLGMQAAFSDVDADFSGMTGKKDLFISAVIHQAFVEVNEEGTEAAAATVVMMLKGTVTHMSVPPKIFQADHPFLFIIQDRKTGLILFIGRVNDPSAM